MQATIIHRLHISAQEWRGKWMLVITGMELLTWQVRKMGQGGVGDSLKVSDRAEINIDISPSGLLVSLSFL